MQTNISCEEYFENLKTLWKEQNRSFKYMVYNDEPVIWKTPNTAGYIKILAYVIIIIGSLLGNLSVILSVALARSLRTTINFYVANLAVADAMITIICMLPHALTVYVGDKFVLGEIMCKFNPFTQFTCLISSVLTLCAITCDRFMAVFRPLEVRTTEKRTTVIIAIIWIISIGVSIPLLIVKNFFILEWSNFLEPKCTEIWPISYYRDGSTNKCVKDQPLRVTYYVVLSVMLFFLPICIMLIAYVKILFRLWMTQIPGEQHEANIKAQSRSRKKVLKMVFLVLIVFIICWTPYQIVILLTAFRYGPSKNRKFPTWFSEFKWFSYYFAYANSFMNPFIYGKFNKSFRDGFCLVLRCGCQRKGSRIGVRSRLTFTTGVTSNSSRSAKMLNCTNKSASQKSVLESKLVTIAQEGKISPSAKETCPSGTQGQRQDETSYI